LFIISPSLAQYSPASPHIQISKLVAFVFQWPSGFPLAQPAAVYTVADCHLWGRSLFSQISSRRRQWNAMQQAKPKTTRISAPPLSSRSMAQDDRSSIKRGRPFRYDGSMVCRQQYWRSSHKGCRDSGGPRQWRWPAEPTTTGTSIQGSLSPKPPTTAHRSNPYWTPTSSGPSQSGVLF